MRWLVPRPRGRPRPTLRHRAGRSEGEEGLREPGGLGWVGVGKASRWK